MKTAPLQDVIDQYASIYEARTAAARVDLWRRVKMKLSIPEKWVTDKDLAYFVRSMGPTYLIRKIHTMTKETADHLLLWATNVEAQ
jgi:hypothetical protein